MKDSFYYQEMACLYYKRNYKQWGPTITKYFVSFVSSIKSQPILVSNFQETHDTSQIYTIISIIISICILEHISFYFIH